MSVMLPNWSVRHRASIARERVHHAAIAAERRDAIDPADPPLPASRGPCVTDHLSPEPTDRFMLPDGRELEAWVVWSSTQVDSAIEARS
jgi:hypothetical protein